MHVIVVILAIWVLLNVAATIALFRFDTLFSSPHLPRARIIRR